MSIVSASRNSDIPWFYAKEFMEDYRRGFGSRPNPYNPDRPIITDFTKASLIVFWSKYPVPMIPYLDEITQNILWQFTVNDYSDTTLEPNVPSLDDRLDVFKRLAERYPVVLRTDPLVLGNGITLDNLFERVAYIATELKDYAAKHVFSFLIPYGKNNERMRGYRTFYTEEKNIFVQQLKDLNLGVTLETCAMGETWAGVRTGGCIDADTIVNAYPEMEWEIAGTKRDTGQREHCQCLKSSSYGMPRCKARCLYCYAT